MQLQKNDVNLLTTESLHCFVMTQRKMLCEKVQNLCRWKLGQHGRTLKNSGIYKELTNSFWVLFMDKDTAHCLKEPLSASPADLDHHSKLIHMISKVLWRILVFSFSFLRFMLNCASCWIARGKHSFSKIRCIKSELKTKMTHAFWSPVLVDNRIQF